MLLAQAAHIVQRQRYLSPHRAGRLEDDGSHIVVERSLGSLEVPGGHQDDALGHRRRNPARWGSVELSEESGRGVVVPAVEVSDQSHDLGSTGDRPRQPQRQLRRFGPRVGEPHAFRAGYQALDPLRPFYLELGASPVVEAFHDLILYRLQNLRMIVAEEQGSMTAGIVDVFVAVHVPLAGTRCVGDVDAVGLDVAGVVGDAAGKQGAGAFGESGGAGGHAPVGLDQRRVLQSNGRWWIGGGCLHGHAWASWSGESRRASA